MSIDFEELRWIASEDGVFSHTEIETMNTAAGALFGPLLDVAEAAQNNPRGPTDSRQKALNDALAALAEAVEREP